MPSTKVPGANFAFLAGLGCTALVFPPVMPTFAGGTGRRDIADDWAALAGDWQRVGLDLAAAAERVVGRNPIDAPRADRADAS